MDLSQVVVVVGFGEVGPWGSSRTRWEMEAYGEFSFEGCIELAWLMGFIKPDEKNKGFWLDAKSGERVKDIEVKPRFEKMILEHTGIRLVEPELFEGYDPNKKLFWHQVAVDEHLSPLEVADKEEADQFVSELGEDQCDAFFDSESRVWKVRLRKGATLAIPKALKFDRFVAGQIPSGWDAKRMGVPEDIASSVDPVTLYTLVATAEAFVNAGIADPYELYEYVHVSEVGNSSGGGMGGMRALKRIYGERSLGKEMPSDTLQECFINTMPAWVNMLLLSSSGPIKTPVGACATAAESIDIGAETILSGKARVVIVGGYDDFGDAGSYEFAQMKATSDAVKETAAGRAPKEMCRPCTSTRDGFMESQGCGIQLLMDAELALMMGCPIYAIVALTNTATDKQGRSVPAPGKGILTTAREVTSFEVNADNNATNTSTTKLLLDKEYRRRQFEFQKRSLHDWAEKEVRLLGEEKRQFVNEMKQRQIRAAKACWGQHFYKNRPDIAPLRGALSVWDLSVDDIGAASFHGTGTKANDSNESQVTQMQMQHLGRSTGNLLPVVCQKYLTGHPKGAAAAWMVNGALQMLQTGVVVGNRNNDNTCDSLKKFNLLVYPNKAILTSGMKAVLVKSFGFGQAGGEVLLVHANQLWSFVHPNVKNKYFHKLALRKHNASKALQKAIFGLDTLVKVKNAPPYSPEQESKVYLNPQARAVWHADINSWKFTDEQLAATASLKNQADKNELDCHYMPEDQIDAAIETEKNYSEIEQIKSCFTSQVQGLGIDIEPLETFRHLEDRQAFIDRNFTKQEQEYCLNAPCTASSFAGRWAAKEAIIKCISSAGPHNTSMWKGPGAPLKDIEIIPSPSGAPVASLSGIALEAMTISGVSHITLSISHAGEYAVAQAFGK